MRYKYIGKKPFLFQGRRIVKGEVIDVKLDGNFIPIKENKTKSKIIMEEE